MTRTFYTKREEWSTGYWAYIVGEDDRGPDNVTGWGATEALAIEDLREQLEADAYNDAHDRWVAGEDEA